ncbi:MAG: glycosyltransferase [Alkalinema sp. RU_4_3]|nr:glycosyltransferase [Alkalinema sp. RU_4_3]
MSLPPDSLLHLWIPTLSCILLVGLVTRVLSPQPSRWSRRTIATLLLFLLGRYLFWRVSSTLNWSDAVTGVLSLGLFAAELLVFTTSVIQWGLQFTMRDRRRQADILAADLAQGVYQPTVDIFVPTYNEPTFILRRTLIGIQALDYPSYRVYLLDDTRRPEVKALAAELGCDYISRPDNRHAKAGNLNHGIAQTDGELLVCFDADFIPTRNFLQRTVGFFQDPSIGLVQTPQSFYNADPIARNLGLENILPPEEEIFYRQIQPLRDGVGSVVCAGTSFVLRRRAIESIGGFVTESLSEDYFTAIKLSAQGHRVIYLNEKLSAGLAAENITVHINQRLRWARGTLQAFFISANPLTIPGLNFMQRLGHLEGILHWFTSLCRVYFLALPVIYSIWGIEPIATTGNELLYYMVPFYLTQFLVFAWLNDRSRSALFSDIYSLILLFPLVGVVIQTTIKPFGYRFQVTPKGLDRPSTQFNLSLAWPLILLWVFNAYSLFQGLTNPRSELGWNWIWSVYNLLMLTVTIAALIDRPGCSSGAEIETFVNLRVGDRSYRGVTTQVAEQGCICVIDSQETIGGNIQLDFPDADFQTPAIVLSHQITADGLVLQLQFQPLSLTQTRHLIALLYCQPNRWQHRQTPSELRSLYLMWRSVKINRTPVSKPALWLPQKNYLRFDRPCDPASGKSPIGKAGV